MRLRRFRYAALLAAIAALMHVFWPLAGRLRVEAPQMVQVPCPVHGVMSVPAERAPAPDSGQRRSCVLCSGATAAITSAFPVIAAATPAVASETPLEHAVPPQQPQHSPSRPRAPPAFS